MQKTVRWPCGVCGRSIGNNSLQCTSCQKWVHKKCSGINGSMYKMMKPFFCRGCVNPVTRTCHTSDISVNANLESVDRFLGHIQRDDLINPVKMSVHQYVCTYIRPYIRTSTLKHNAATSKIVVFVKVDETFTKI